MTELMALEGRLFVFRTLATIALVVFVGATSVCDVVNSHDASEFCTQLETVPGLSEFNNQTSNITVLAFTNHAYYSSSLNRDIGIDKLPIMQRHILRGLHTSATINNHTEYDNDNYEYLPTETLETFLEDANLTGGHYIGASHSNGNSMIKFWSGKAWANAAMVDVPFDGGLIHIVDNVLELPQNFRKVISNMTTLSDDERAGTSVFQEALWVVNMTYEIESIQNITILAPSDSDFYNIGSIFDGMSKDDLRRLLSYHILMNNITYIDNRLSLQDSSWSAPTLAGKHVNVTFGGRSFDSVARQSSNNWITNGNIISISGVLDPDHPGTAKFPNAKVVAASQPLFNNIIGERENSTSESSSLSSSDLKSNSSQGISMSERAGILVGVVIGMLVLLLLGMWALLRQQRKFLLNQKESYASFGDDTQHRVELGSDSGQESELNGEAVAPELLGNHNTYPYELK